MFTAILYLLSSTRAVILSIGSFRTFQEVSFMFRSLTFAFLLVSLPLFAGVANALVTLYPVESPNKDFKIVVAIGPIDDVSFALFYKGALLFTASGMSFELDDGDQLPATASFTFRHIRDGGEPPPTPSKYATNSTGTTQVEYVHDVQNNVDYNAMSVNYQKRKEGAGELPAGATRLNPEDYEDVVKIVFRAYNGGIAYRYEIATKKGETITIKNENVKFVFPDDYSCTVSVIARQSLRSDVLVAKDTSLSKVEKGSLIRSIEFRNGAGTMEMHLGEIYGDKGFARLKYQPDRKLMGTFSNLYDGEGHIDRTGKMTALGLFLDGISTIRGTGLPYHTPWRALVMPPPNAAAEATLRSLL